MLTIRELREEKKWSQSELANKLNVSLRTVQNYEADQSKIPLNKLHNIYKILNVDLSNSLVFQDITPTQKAITSYSSGRPFFEGDWELGFKDSFDENMVNPEFNIDFPPANKTEGFWMRGKGKSMLGEIDPGDFLYFSELEDFSWFPFGRIYGIVTKNKMRTVKRIVKSEKDGHYLLVSTNPDKASYPDQDIPAEMIEKIFEVKFVIKNLDE